MYYRILKRIISNRDNIFISNYNKKLILLLRIILKLFKVYYHKTNRQTKKTKQSFKQYQKYKIYDI